MANRIEFRERYNLDVRFLCATPCCPPRTVGSMTDSLIRDEEGDALHVFRVAFRKAVARHRVGRLDLFHRLQFPCTKDNRADDVRIRDGINLLPAVDDAVLEVLAERFEACLRPRDRAYRYGGEEFLIMLPDTSLNEARNVADRLRHSVGGRPVVEEGLSLDQTISIGVAEIHADEDTESGLQRADRALYEAKDAGRNRVVVMQREQ